MRHELEQEVLNDNKEKYDLCILLLYSIDKNKHKEYFSDIKDILIKKASGYKMMVDYMGKNVILNKAE